MTVNSRASNDDEPVHSESTLRRLWSSGFLAALGLFVVMGGIAVPVALNAHRARTQAAIVAELRNNEALPVYSCDVFDDQRAQRPWSTRLPSSVRERLGVDFIDEVLEVIASRFDFDANKEEPLTEEQTRRVCELCRRLPSLRRFSIKSESFEFEQIASWPHFSELTELGIDCNNLSDRDLESIGTLKHLWSLELRSDQITDAGLRHLAGLTNIRDLRLNCPGVTDAGLKHLARFDQLRKIKLTLPGVGDEGILNLRPTQLEEVFLFGVKTSDRGADHLVSGGRIRYLNLEDSAVTGASLEAIARCKSLTVLHIPGAKITSESLAALAGLRISSVTLDNNPITDEGLEHLATWGYTESAGSRHLGSISLADTLVTGVGAKHLETYSRIHRLDLSGAPLTREGIAQIAKLNVHKLNLSRTPLSDEDLLHFVANNEMRELDVRQTQVTPQGVRRFKDARVKNPGVTKGVNLISDFREEDLPDSELTPEDFMPHEEFSAHTPDSGDSAEALENQP